MDTGKQKTSIKYDIEELNTRSKKALDFFAEGKYEEAKDEIEEIYTSCDFMISELDTMMEDEEEKEEKKEVATETTPPPQSSPQEQTPIPAGSPK